MFVFGASEGEMDHFIGNMSTALKYNENTELFDYITVCNGHYEIPHFPKDKLVDNEATEYISHSKS